jgi:hypothetical protein
MTLAIFPIWGYAYNSPALRQGANFVFSSITQAASICNCNSTAKDVLIEGSAKESMAKWGKM